MQQLTVLATPIYQANATLQYDKASQVSLVDQMSEMMPLASSGGQVDSEIEVIKSRMVLGKTVTNLNLDTQIAPAGFLISCGVIKPMLSWLSI